MAIAGPGVDELASNRVEVVPCMLLKRRSEL